MSIMNPLPPQAYTKETLVQAYAWLQTQNDSIKELAATPDVLVSLYLKAKLQGHGALERPSIQNFKNELKNLAGMIGDFENPGDTVTASPLPASIPAPPPGVSPSAASMTSSSATFRFRSSDFKVQMSEKAQTAHAPPQPVPATPATIATEPDSLESPQIHSPVDRRSWDMIQEVKVQFNLSSDTEAMRFLIAIGYNHAKTLLK